MFFDGFTLAHISVPGGTIRSRHGGSGGPFASGHNIAGETPGELLTALGRFF